MIQEQTTKIIKKRKGGRPRLSVDERRSYQVRIGLTPAQYLKIEQRAESAGLNEVELIRRLAISQQFYTVPAINRTALVELNKIGVNLNQLTKSANQTSALNVEAIQQIKAEIKNIAKTLVGSDDQHD